MNALMRKKKEWEFQNERYFWNIIETSADVSVESAKKAGQITSFFLYLAYKFYKMMLALVWTTFNEPRLVRYSTPERAHEALEPEARLMESQFSSPFILKR